MLADLVNDLVDYDTLNEVEQEQLVNALNKNTDEFTTLKFLEEVNELGEKLIKYHLKSKSHKPKLTDILDEIGDVMIRTALFIDRETDKNHDFDIMDYLDARIQKKLKKLHGYVKEGKYQGGL
jgi:hypothetical protein